MTQEASAPAQDLRLETRKTPEATIVVCSGKINSNTTPLLHSAIQPLIPDSKRILLDVSAVNYVDSSGIGGLVRLWFSAKTNKCEFQIINLNERIRELLRMSNLAKMLEGDQEYHKYLS
jgi:anti-sigma B factor antagonist